MVRAILDGRKTQTRRVVKPQPYIDSQGNACWNSINFGQDGSGRPLFRTLASPLPCSKNKRVLCPYGRPSDRLWVRETWGHFERAPKAGDQIYYRADGECLEIEPWRPSIHMPRWASRLALEITGIRVERLQDISEADAIAEGCTQFPNGYYRGGPHKVSGLKQMASAVHAYRDLWESINGAGSWDANPWIWVVDFKRLEGGAA